MACTEQGRSVERLVLSCLGKVEGDAGCFQFFYSNPQLSDFVLSASNFRLEAGGLALFGFVFSPIKSRNFLILSCYQRAYTNLGPTQIGFVLHFLVDL